MVRTLILLKSGRLTLGESGHGVEILVAHALILAVLSSHRLVLAETTPKHVLLFVRALFFKVIVEDYVVVILLDKVLEAVVFMNERLQFWGRSVVGQFSRMNIFVIQHGREQ